MYHAVYPQMVIALKPQETGIPGSSAISLYEGIQFLSLSNSQDNDNYINNSIKMAGAAVGSQPTYPQNMVFNRGNILSNQQQTSKVLAMSNSNKLISLANSLETNHAHANNMSNNQYNHEVFTTFNQVPQNMHQNYNSVNKQYGNPQKDRKYGAYNNQHAYGNKHNNQNNYKRQNTVFNNGDRPQQQNQNKRNGNSRGENQNQNNNYQNHNRNHFNAVVSKRNWGWHNKQQRNQNKIVRNADCSSSASSSSSVRMSSSPPITIEVKQTPNKKESEISHNCQNTQITPRKSPTLGEFMLKTLIDKEHQVKHCSKSLSMKRNNTNPANENGAIVTSNNCIFAECWPDHYGFSNQQTYYNKGYRMNQQMESKHIPFQQQMSNGYGNQKKRENQDNRPQNVRDHRFGACYQRTRRFHLSLANEQTSVQDKAKPIGHSIPYSLHNLVLLCNYYNLSPCNGLPYCPQNFFVPADRFMVKAHASSSLDELNYDISDSPFDLLSEAIWQKYLLVRQSKETYMSKLMLWKYLFLFIKNFYVRFSLFLVGSTMTGFASNCSDVDFCLIVRNTEIDQRNEAQMYLDDVFTFILQHASDYFENIRLFPAKVPILRFHDCVQSLDVDINCNNFVGIRNTHLLHCYNQMDWRVRPLVLTVKHWARGNQMNSARESTISSYSLTLMVIHYLQCGVTPPILPCLHAMFPEKFDICNDIHSIDIHEKLEPYKTDNKQTLGDLLLGFFEYYSKFDYASYAISVRLAKLVQIETCKHEPMPKNDPAQWLYICIEEPFDRTNTARSVYLYNMFLYIKSVFDLSYEKLKQSGDLETIMDLGLSIPDSQCSSPPPKGISAIKPEIRKPKFRNGCCVSNEIPTQKIEILG